MYNETCYKRRKGEGEGKEKEKEKRSKRCLLHCPGMKWVVWGYYNIQDTRMEWEKRRGRNSGLERIGVTTYFSERKRQDEK